MLFKNDWPTLSNRWQKKAETTQLPFSFPYKMKII